MINRRGLITGLIAFAAAPAIVRASSLMPVKVMDRPIEFYGFDMGSTDYTAIARYIYLEDGSVKIKSITVENFYK